MLLAKAKQMAHPDEVDLLLSFKHMMAQMEMGLNRLGPMIEYLLPSMDTFPIGPSSMNQGPTTLPLNITSIRSLQEIMSGLNFGTQELPFIGAIFGSDQMNPTGLTNTILISSLSANTHCDVEFALMADGVDIPVEDDDLRHGLVTGKQKVQDEGSSCSKPRIRKRPRQGIVI